MPTAYIGCGFAPLGIRSPTVNEAPDKSEPIESRGERLRQLIAVFLKLGSVGFGGPAVHFATIEEEAVQRRGWLTRQHYLDVLGATNLIPGPNSTEVAMHVGYYRAGFLGLAVAGVSFILPAALLSTLFAWIYVRYGQLDFVQPLLAGAKPAVIAVIFSAGWRLGTKALRGPALVVIAVAAMIGSFAQCGPILTLLAVSFGGLLWLRWTKYRDVSSKGGGAPGSVTGWLAAAMGLSGARVARAGGTYAATTTVMGAVTAAAAPVSYWQMAFLFLKVGAVLYGTGYVLLAYLEGGLVRDLGWLTQEQLLDAFAVGNLTPGPILSTATFLGFFLLAPQGTGWGLAGAATATIAIFLPSFLFVAILGPIIPRLRQSRWAAAFLDAVNAASIGLIAAVTLNLCGEIFFVWPENGGMPELQWQALLIAVIAAGAHFRFRVMAAWLVMGGAASGWVLSLVWPV
jgi:chromate transporter